MLRMKLNRVEGSRLVYDPLVGAVVLVGEELAPAGRHGLGADGVAVVLRGHVAAARALQPARLVVPSVPVSEGTEGSHWSSFLRARKMRKRT
jgi:hypothetical protein